MTDKEVDRRFAEGRYSLNTQRSAGSQRLSDRVLNLPDRIDYQFKGKDNQTYRVRYMENNVHDLNTTTEVFRKGFAELHNSVFEAFVKPVQLKNVADRYKIFVVEDQKKKIVAARVIEPNPVNMDVTWQLVTVDPKMRGKGIFKSLAVYTDQYIQNSGADYASMVASTFQEANQIVFESLGFRIAGRFSGLILAPNRDGTYNRQPVTIYEKWYKNQKDFSPTSHKLTKKGKILENKLKSINS